MQYTLCIFLIEKKKEDMGPGEKAQHLRALVALAEDPDSVPSIHMTAHKYIIVVPEAMAPHLASLDTAYT